MTTFARRLIAVPRYPIGNALALFAAAWAYMPLLVPREFWPQGFQVWIFACLGYLLGRWATQLIATILTLGSTVSYEQWLDIFNGKTTALWSYLLAGPGALVVLVWAWIRTMEQSRLLGMPNLAVSRWIAAAVLALILWFVSRALVLALSDLYRRLNRWATLVLALIIVGLLFALGGGGMRVIDTYTQATDRSQPKHGVVAPTLPEHSGGPGSFEDWEQLGLQGKYFTSFGATKAQIAAAMGEAVAQPIRAYATIQAHGTIASTVAAALQELDRTRAWERKYLVVATATGTGWVDEWGTEAVEYLSRGDVATVSIQYSYLPSVMSFLTGSQVSEDAGYALFDAIKHRISQLPPQQRPKLYVMGESLGAYGALAAFQDPQDLVTSVDGAVFAGTPAFTPLLKQIYAQRDPESSMRLPRYPQYPQLQFFSSEKADLMPWPFLGSREQYLQIPEDQRKRIIDEQQVRVYKYLQETVGDQQWGKDGKRIAFIQHASDPVAWWQMNLLWREPDWLKEQKTEAAQSPQPLDVLWQPAWVPLTTFLSVSADLPGASRAPSGHGHSYQQDLIATWGMVFGCSETDIRNAGFAIYNHLAGVYQ